MKDTKRLATIADIIKMTPVSPEMSIQKTNIIIEVRIKLTSWLLRSKTAYRPCVCSVIYPVVLLLMCLFSHLQIFGMETPCRGVAKKSYTQPKIISKIIVF